MYSSNPELKTVSTLKNVIFVPWRQTSNLSMTDIIVEFVDGELTFAYWDLALDTD